MINDKIKRSSISYEFIDKAFPSEQAFIGYFEKMKYPNGIKCPRCKSKQIYKVKNYPKKRQCGACRKSFSIFKDTIFENSKIPLKKWLFAMHMVVNARKSVSACQMCREMDVSYKTSWRLLHKIRGAMSERNEDIKLFKFIEEINKNYTKKKTKDMKDKTTESSGQAYSPRGEPHEESSAVSFIKFTEKYIGNGDKHLGKVLPSLGDETQYGVRLSEILINTTKYTRSHVKIKTCESFGI